MPPRRPRRRHRRLRRLHPLAEGLHRPRRRRLHLLGPATDAAGNPDASPATRSFSVDTGAPDTTIDTGPTGTTANNDPSFAYSSDEPGSSFECRLDGPGAATGDFADCTPSPKAYPDLADGAYSFPVRPPMLPATPTQSPATRSFSVDTGAPDTTIDTGPTGTTANNDPSFAYSSDEPGSSFECRLDGPGAATGDFADCTPSPKAYTDLADGAYTFSVRATDAAGNVDQSPDTRAFSVETTVDNPPVAVSDTATVAEDSGATSINVRANDTDVDGGPKTVLSVTQPAHGAVVITGGGTGLTYQPNANYCNGPAARPTISPTPSTAARPPTSR